MIPVAPASAGKVRVGNEEAFEALRIRYRTRLQADLRELEALYERLAQSGGAAGHPVGEGRLIGLVHSLAGASGTFGFSELGDRAALLEELLIEGAEADPGRIRTAFDDLLAEMRRSLG